MEVSWKMESSHRHAERLAADWLCRRDSGQWSGHDQLALEAWLAQSPGNAVAFIRLDAAWKQADRFKALGAGYGPRHVPTQEQLRDSPFFAERAAGHSSLQALLEEEPEPDSLHKPSARKHPARVFRWSYVAAAIFFAAFLAWHSAFLAPAYRTPVGGLAQVPMADGSRITLNTDTEVRTFVTDAERSVVLKHGEAYFEVAKDPLRPFVVRAGSMRIVAVGTQFSVRRAGEDIRVVVTEGAVRAARDSRGDDVLLEAGATAHTVGDDVLVQSRAITEAQEDVSWRSGLVVFRNVNLGEAVVEFNRYNEQKIVIVDPALASIRLSGKFKATNFSAFVRLLEDGFPIEAREDNGRILLVSRQP